MIPARIQVFDGLRVTTEHILHFQESLQSAIEEVRAVLGLGRVHVGFEVATLGPASVTVAPGIAFDAAGGRIVHEEAEPVTLDAATLAAGPAVLYARRELVEKGHIEGRATLLWDDCSFHLRTAPPEPADGLVPLARVRSGAEGLVVEPLVAAPDARDAPDASEALPVSAPAVPAPAPASGGVVRLAGLTRGDAGRAPLLTAVRATLAPTAAADALPATSSGAAPAENAVLLGAAPLAASQGGSVTALAAHLLLCATLRDSSPPVPGGAAATPLWRRECDAHGDARADGAGWPQNALCRTVTFLPNSATRLARGALCADALALLVLPLATPEETTPLLEEGGNPEPLALRVRIQPDTPPRIVVELVWSGRAHEGLLAQADALLESLEWSLDAAWQGN